MDEKNLVIKSNKLNEARYRLTLQEQKWVLLAIAEIQPNDEDLKEYHFQVKDFMDLVGLKGGSSYSQLKDLARSLMEKTVTIQESDGVLITNWFSFIKYYNHEGSISLAFSPKLKPYLLALKKEFTRYQLHNVIRLKSSYSVRVYELLKQYQAIGWRTFELSELRSMLCVPEGSLFRYHDFKKRVLDVAKKELVNSDILFDYEPIKKVRKVVEIHFTIYPNKAVIDRSKKFKDDIEIKKIQHEEQIKQDAQDKKQADLSARLSLFESTYPKDYLMLQKQAKNRLKKEGLYNPSKPGFNLTLKFKMMELLPGFLERKKIKLDI